MPPRLNKRQQRELEELEALQASQVEERSADLEDNGEESQEDDEEVTKPVSGKKTGFAGFAEVFAFVVVVQVNTC